MKILNIVAEGRFGGPQKRILEVAKVLKKKGIETIVVFPNYDSDKFQSLLSKDNIPFETLSIHRLTKDLGHLSKFVLLFPLELYRLTKIIKKHRPDVIHCNGSWQIKGVVAAKLTGTKSVWHLNDTFMPGYILWLFRIIARLFSHKFIASSVRTTAFYGPHIPKAKRTMDIVLPPVHTQKMNPEIVTPSEDIASYSGVKVVIVGNVNPIKGYDTFIKMAAHAKTLTGDKQLHFFIVGKILDSQKKYTAQLRQMVKEFELDNVHFLGGRDDVPNCLKAADIFICSSDAEAGPMSVFEAMSMEKPVVSTDVGDVSILFGGNDCGIIVPVQDYKKMAEEVVRLAENKEARKLLGEKARQKAIEQLDIETCAQVHADVYTKVIAEEKTINA